MHTIKCYIKDELKEHENNIKERGGIASSVLERFTCSQILIKIS